MVREDGDRPTSGAWLSELVNARLARRDALKVIAGMGAWAATAGARAAEPAGELRSSLTFAEVGNGRDQEIHVPEGYEAQIVLRWGDPLHADAPEFDPAHQTRAAQSRQFGANCDFVAFLPLPCGSRTGTHGLLCVNHEFTQLPRMFAELAADPAPTKVTREHVDAEMAALGLSVVEIRQGDDGRWQLQRDSAYNRRFDMVGTTFALTGPVAGSDRVRTAADPEGRTVIGTAGNCAGGVTPWGTVLSCEENFQTFFFGALVQGPEAANAKVYQVGGKSTAYMWAAFHPRFRLDREPREPNRFGWVVEIDPYDPASVPVKRTALGRIRHEGATCVVAGDGRVVVYTGDDQPGQFLYRFVSAGRYDPDDRAANRTLLDEGTLSAARFAADGTLEWLPLVFGTAPLDAEHGFSSMADVLVETRRAAALLGATPLDRPEDVETNPSNGRTYIALTNNVHRGVDLPTDAANPRAANVHGHLVELAPPQVDGVPDHTSATMKWEIFILAGDPRDEQHGARYGDDQIVGASGWFSCPDNLAFDERGRIWIATDGSGHTADGIYACDAEGRGRALTRHFMRGPSGAELCGPCFTPGDRTLFAAIQHPPPSGPDGELRGWPDFREGVPPRASVIAIRRRDGGVIGT